MKINGMKIILIITVIFAGLSIAREDSIRVDRKLTGYRVTFITDTITSPWDNLKIGETWININNEDNPFEEPDTVFVEITGLEGKWIQYIHRGAYHSSKINYFMTLFRHYKKPKKATVNKNQ